ncbi:unnamed protein product [Adineta steineri]|uniref:Uncharacterized protein n=1 Tax=Adineta steineri TaxID=433720 RepID=A0A813QEQ9_9BILA|nr:unnamed protein product [Adineta steineri]CAF1085002.1 unnamed protein product [Adineta steineri]
MLSDYTFLSDHSYSLRPVADDNDDLPLNQREGKTKKRSRSSNRINKTTLTSNRTVSIDRSSSDKENNSLISLHLNRVSLSSTSPAINTTKLSKDIRLQKKTSSRLSVQTTMTNSRTQSGNKQDNKTRAKTGIKSTQSSIAKKKKITNRGKTKSINISQNNSIDILPSLSIEERVKLRRTKPLQLSTTSSVETKPVKISKSQSTKIRPIQQDSESITNNSSSKKPTKITKSRKNSPVVSTIKTTKLFLGSGLDLDNIVPGNRQRRSVQT